MLKKVILPVVAILGFAGTLFAGPIEDLKPGEWYEVPNSALQNCSERARTAQFAWVNEGPFGAIMDTWCGGVLDSKRDRLLIGPGGGHASYATNEVYYFDLNTLVWHRLTDPDANTGGCPNDPAPPADVAPFAMHTYDGIEYLPNVDKYLVVGGWCTPYTYALDLSNSASTPWPAGRWTVPSTDQHGRTGDVSAYDSVTGCFYYGAGASGDFARFNPLTNTWTTLATGIWSYLYHMTGAIDAKRRVFVAVGERGSALGKSGVRSISLNTTTPVCTILNTTGDVSAESGNAPGTEYDPITDKIVCWKGGPDVYSFDLDTKAWSKHPPAGSNTADPGNPNMNGTYGRFRYSPNKNVYVVVNKTSTNVFIYRHAIKDATAASIPASLAANATSYSSVHLSWQASTDAESNVMSYYIYRGGVQIARAFTPAFDDTGLTELTSYSYEVSAINGAYTETAKSAPASVSTPADNRPPVIVNVTTRADSTRVFVLFNEPLEAASAGIAANYSINNSVTVSGAVLGSDLKSVTLTVSRLDAATTYTLSVSNVRDKATTPNSIIAGSSKVFYYNKPVIAINCGGPRYVGKDGMVYLADTLFTGGSADAGNANAVIANTDDTVLYRTNRYGNSQYAIPVTNGTYRVTLKFAETYYSATGYRKFHIQAEGASTGSIDLVGRVGALAAFDTTLLVAVADGILNLSFIAENDVLVSAIAVTAGAGPANVAETHLPATTLLSGIHMLPNPCAGSATIFVSQPRGLKRLGVYDLKGQCVANLMEKAGSGTIQWNTSLPSGLYLLKAEYAHGVSLKKTIMVVK